MKRFLKTLLLFLLPPVLALAAWTGALFTAEYVSYRNGLVLPTDAKYVAVGHSLTAHAFDPAKIPHFVNLASDGSSLEQWLYKVEDLYDANPGMRFDIVIGLCPRDWVSRPKPMKVDAYEGRFVFLNILHAGEGWRKLAAPVRLFRDRFLYARGRAARKWLCGKRGSSRYSECAGEYAPVTKTRADAPPGLLERSMNDQVKSYGKLLAEGGQSACRDYYAAICETARKRGGRVIFVSTPLHATYLDGITPARAEAFEADIRAFCATNGARYVSYMRLPLPEEAFCDFHHVNTNGAAVVSARFAAEARSLE